MFAENDRQPWLVIALDPHRAAVAGTLQGSLGLPARSAAIRGLLAEASKAPKHWLLLGNPRKVFAWTAFTPRAKPWLHCFHTSFWKFGFEECLFFFFFFFNLCVVVVDFG